VYRVAIKMMKCFGFEKLKPQIVWISNHFILLRVNNTSCSGQNSPSLLGWQLGSEQKSCHLVLLEKMILVK